MKLLTVTGTIFLCLFCCASGWLMEQETSRFCENQNLTLDFANTVIRKLGKNFVTSSVITCLNFAVNEINTIEDGAFDGTPNLRYLDLSHNSIHQRNLFSFGNIPNVETLILSNQAPSCCEDALVSYTYPNVRYLDLSGSGVRKIRNSTGSDSEFTEMIFPQLIYLDLSNNGIEDTDVINKLSEKINYLYLHGNRIPSMTTKNLHGLLELTLDNNQINRVDYYADLLSLNLIGSTSLTNLSLSENQISFISSSAFDDTINLKYLNISNNRLRTIENDAFTNATSLETLILDYNILTSVPIITRPLNITYLSINCNQIQRLPGDIFFNLPQLRTLYLNNNEISNVATYAFETQEMLEELHLAANKLTALPKNWCKFLKRIRYLDLSNNQFTTLESLSLNDALPLEYLYVGEMSLNYLTANSFDTIPENITINFHEIPEHSTELCVPHKYRSRYYP